MARNESPNILILPVISSQTTYDSQMLGKHVVNTGEKCAVEEMSSCALLCMSESHTTV
jgi:hypothetical protein